MRQGRRSVVGDTKRVAPWVRRRLFSIRPEGPKRELMYVPNQQLRKHWEDDETRKRVLYVPAGSMVMVTSTPLVVKAGDIVKRDIR